MSHDVFISYASKDKPTADAVCAKLESRGIRCWIAPRDIVPGSDWGESVVGGIKNARVMVVVFSTHANESPQIKREVERAVNKGIPIIPLRIENVAPSPSLEYFISTPHWLDAFTPPLERHLHYLADVIQKILSTPLENEGIVVPGEFDPPRTVGQKRKAIWMCVLFLTGVAGLLGWFGFERVHNTKPKIISGPIAWWKADGDALDAAGANNGTLVNGATFGPGKTGQAFYFNGSSYVSVPNSAAWAFGTNDFSIALWANYSNILGSQAFLASTDGGGHLNKWIFWRARDRLGFLVLNNSPDAQLQIYSTNKFIPTPGQWYHVAVTRKDYVICLYINGDEVFREPWGGSVPQVVVPLTIGKAESGYWFHGLIDDVRIYHRAVSPAELAGMAQTGLTTASPPPSAGLEGRSTNIF